MDDFFGIGEESLSDALANGNLRGEKTKAQRALEKPLISKWTHQGYHASIMVYSCACGTVEHRLQGVFSVEKANDGSRRTTSVKPAQIPADAIRYTEYPHFATTECAKCITAFGFHPKGEDNA